MSLSCPPRRVSDALGRPGEGVHAWRLPLAPGFDVAAFDVLLTAGAALLVAGVSARKNRSPARALAVFVVAFIVLVALGAVAHRALCVGTALNKKLGLAPPRRD